MRLFTALAPDAALRRELAGIQESLKQQGIQGRYSRPENLHMTLVFLGECTPAQKDIVLRILDSLPVPQVTLVSRGLGHFGPMWFVAFEPCRALADWVQSFGQALEAAGIPFDRKRWVPHVTLVRRPDAAPDAVIPRLRFDARKAILFESSQPAGVLTYPPLN